MSRNLGKKTKARRHITLGHEQKRSMVCRRCYKLFVFQRPQLCELIQSQMGNSDEGAKKMKKFFLRKMKKCIFGRNPKASYFMTETLKVQKVAYILASLFEGEWVSYLFSVPRNIRYKLDKNGKNSEKFFHYFIC